MLVGKIKNYLGATLDSHIHVTAWSPAAPPAPMANGGLPPNPGSLFPVRALSAVFRGKYLAALSQAYNGGELRFAGSTAQLTGTAAFRGFLDQLRAHDWVVYAKPPFAGAAQVLSYLGRYTHRVAIANHRLVSFENGEVCFLWRDYAHGNKTRIMALSAEEFLRRFLLHTLPTGFVKIRHYGLLGNRCRHRKVARCRALLDQPAPEPQQPESIEEMMLRLTGIDIQRCPACRQGRMRVILSFAPGTKITARPQSDRATAMTNGCNSVELQRLLITASVSGRIPPCVLPDTIGALHSPAYIRLERNRLTRWTIATIISLRNDEPATLRSPQSQARRLQSP